MKKETIVIYVDVLERCHFFTKFYTPLRELGYDVWFITARLSIVRQIEKLTPNITILKNTSNTKSQGYTLDYNKSLSVLNNYHSLEQAQMIGSSVDRQLHDLSKDHDIKMLWIWNGTTTIAMTITAFGKKRGIETRYFEISNLSKRIFVDIEGTSGASYLCQNPEVLDSFIVDEDKYREWLSTYHQEDLLPKQAANRSKIPWPAIIDLLGYMKGYIREDKRNVLKLLYNRWSNKVSNPSFTQTDLNVPYVFLPLQVSDDSQLKLFSNYSNIDLLEEALNISNEKGLILIVKIHPAESNRDEIKHMIKLSQTKSFIIANNPTKMLIQNAQLIIVNNSTVGLQSLIEDKDVMIFGNAIYRHFDQARLKTYILDYLLIADYFGDDVISMNTTRSILEHNLWKSSKFKQGILK